MTTTETLYRNKIAYIRCKQYKVKRQRCKHDIGTILSTLQWERCEQYVIKRQQGKRDIETTLFTLQCRQCVQYNLERQQCVYNIKTICLHCNFDDVHYVNHIR